MPKIASSVTVTHMHGSKVGEQSSYNNYNYGGESLVTCYIVFQPNHSYADSIFGLHSDHTCGYVIAGMLHSQSGQNYHIKDNN